LGSLAVAYTATAKATDENLTSENWEYILDVCDKVGASDAGPKEAVAAMIKRLAHRNANVQLYTLELANALSQNCGVAMHRELASRSFTDAMLRLAGDRVRYKYTDFGLPLTQDRQRINKSRARSSSEWMNGPRCSAATPSSALWSKPT
jgi:hypothetical protein